MSEKTRIALIPIDNRPVCMSLPAMIAQIDPSLDLVMPPVEIIGSLKKTAEIDAIYAWIKSLENVDYFIVSLDTAAYGGLIPSRRSCEGYSQIRDRMDRFYNLFEEKNAKVLAFSSIMRISDNNENEEEKSYWAHYGKAIFKYSYEIDKYGVSESTVPPEILHDFMFTRKRNFDMNRRYLEWCVNEFFDTFVLSKDDCAPFGFNVQECRRFKDTISKKGLKTAHIKTGADEIPLSLLSRIVTKERKIKIAPVFTYPDYVHLISNYEDVSVFDSVKGQIELAGCEMSTEDEADIILYVNNFKKLQGELVLAEEAMPFEGEIELPQKPFVIADILNANGADNGFVKKLMDKDFFTENFLGFAAWNTTGNTLGSALCCALVKFCSKNPDIEAFKKVQTVRFLDDWAYQANARKYLKSYCKEPDVLQLKKIMAPFERLLSKKLKTNYKNISYNFPWNRFFEIGINPE